MPETDLLPEIVIDDTADGYVETDEEPQSEDEPPASQSFKF